MKRETPAGIVWSWRIRLGLMFFVVSLGWPLVVPVLALLGVEGVAIAAFTAVMVGVAEVLLVVAVALAGKDGFTAIKQLVFGFFRDHGPPQTVGPVRYAVGLVLFTVPLVYAWATPYVSIYAPAVERYETPTAIALDVTLAGSLFVLGGDFWDKLRALFVHRAQAVFPPRSEGPAPQSVVKTGPSSGL